MFIDAREIEDGAALEAEVCVIGGGAAGITVARALIGSGLRVMVLESGGFEFEDQTQSLYEGTNVRFPQFDLDTTRLRYFGGTTNHWAGHCRPLDAIDFEPRAWMAHSGWPISRQDLDPYYRQAQAILELPPFHYDDLDFLVERAGAPALPLDDRRLKSVVYNQSPPTRFGESYRDELRRATNVEVHLHANVLELECDATASRVTATRVACIDGPNFSVSARQFVLAMGGMEIPRLLLLSNRVAPAGLGNTYDLVGRYFLNHVILKPVAVIELSADDITLPLYHDLHEVAGGLMFAVLAAPAGLLRAEGLGNFRMHVYQVALPSPGQEALKVLGKTLRSGTLPDDLAGHLGALLTDLDGATNLVYRRLFHTESDLFEQAPLPGLELHLVCENTPDPASRVTLSDERDLFGQNRIAVDWRVSDDDLRTANRAGELAALEFGRLGLGRAKVTTLDPRSETWRSYLEFGTHHSGTTRMSNSPRTGVVDADCRVHGIANLYVASCAVFPTNGYANPTLTITALALRLADHLKENMA